MYDSNAIASLPDDPDALRRIILSLARREQQAARQRDEASRQRDEAARQRDEAVHRMEQKVLGLQQRVDDLSIDKLRLEVELLRLKKWYYGPRADRLGTLGEVNQMLLEFAGQLEARPIEEADLPPAAETPVDAGGAERPADGASLRRVRRGRRNLADFDKLPVVQHVHDLSEDQKLCPCCGKTRQQIGQEKSWQVEYIPAHFERIEHLRLKYACAGCRGADGGQGCPRCDQSSHIDLADKPAQPIEKGMAGPGLLAYIVTSKYADYLPLYRLENIFQRNGLEISRATQSIWCSDVAELIRPLYGRMIQRLLQSHLVCTDDTIMPMLAPGKTRRARMWVYIGDDDNPYNLFDFTLGRGRDGPMSFLREYKQTLLADAYGGYDGVVVGNDIARAGCWAHARRKFVDCEKVHPAIAREAVDLIGGLYGIEERAKPLDIPARLALRRAESVPILARFRDKLLGWRDQLLPKHPMAQAINYALNQWPHLNAFAQDGSVPIDNNISEREMKRVVLNRKNSLFVGNERGGRTAAILSSFTSTCRRHAINPQHYLTQLLTNLPATPISQLDQWLPDEWKRNQERGNA